MSDSVRPHRQQPTRLCCPWDSPGKNTGVGCHFLLQCMKVKSESEVSQLCLTLSDPTDCTYQAHPSMDFPGKSTGVGCQCLLQVYRIHIYKYIYRIYDKCSCLENPRDSRAWWAAVYGVAHSRTRLKRLSSSSSSCLVWGLLRIR